jgi:hypothetical protein
MKRPTGAVGCPSGTSAAASGRCPNPAAAGVALRLMSVYNGAPVRESFGLPGRRSRSSFFSPWPRVADAVDDCGVTGREGRRGRRPTQPWFNRNPFARLLPAHEVLS